MLPRDADNDNSPGQDESVSVGTDRAPVKSGRRSRKPAADVVFSKEIDRGEEGWGMPRLSRRPLRAAALLLVLGAVLARPAAAAATVDTRDIYELDGRFTGLRVDGTVVAPRGGVGVVAVTVALRDGRGGPVTGAALANLTFFGGRTPASTATLPGGTHQSICPAPMQCTLSADRSTLSFRYELLGSGDIHATVYVVTHAASTRVRSTSRGWRHRSGRGGLHVAVDEGATAGARSDGTDALAYRLAGGARGSIAVAGQTCSPEDTGLVALTADADPTYVDQQVCGDAWVTDYAATATTWTAVTVARAAKAKRSGLVVIDI
jgi:hypothetical protein